MCAALHSFRTININHGRGTIKRAFRIKNFIIVNFRCRPFYWFLSTAIGGLYSFALLSDTDAFRPKAASAKQLPYRSILHRRSLVYLSTGGDERTTLNLGNAYVKAIPPIAAAIVIATNGYKEMSWNHVFIVMDALAIGTAQQVAR